MRDYTLSDFRTDYRTGPSAWPGGYPRHFILSDGEALCFKCAWTERREVIRATADPRDQSGWRVAACDVNWEDPGLHCAHCGGRIKSAYAEDV